MGFEDWMLEDGYGDEMEYMDYLERQYYKSCAKYIPSTNNRHKDKQVHNTFYSTCVQGTLEFIDSQHGVLCKGDEYIYKNILIKVIEGFFWDKNKINQEVPLHIFKMLNFNIPVKFEDFFSFPDFSLKFERHNIERGKLKLEYYHVKDHSNVFKNPDKAWYAIYRMHICNGNSNHIMSRITKETDLDRGIVIPWEETFPWEETLLYKESKDSNYVKIKIKSKILIIKECCQPSIQDRIMILTLEKEILGMYDIKIGSDLTDIFPKCRISVREQVGEPFWKLEDRVQSPKMTPANEEKGTPAMVHLHEGLPIYRQICFCLNEENPNYNDAFVETTEMITEEEFNTRYK